MNLPLPGAFMAQGTVVTSPPQVHTTDAAMHANAQQFADPFRRQIVVVGIGILLSLRPKEKIR